jgi:hypothetical protein
LPHHTVGIHLEENSVVSYENREDLPNNAGDVSDVEASAIPLEPSVEAKHNMLNTSLDRLDVTEVTTHRRLASISEIEAENNCYSNGSENDDISTKSRSTMNEVQDHPVPAPPDKETTASVLEHNMPDHADSILGMFNPV